MKKQTCFGCDQCKIVHDTDNFTKTKCIAISRKGRTMDYHATHCYSIKQGQKVFHDPMPYLEKNLKNHVSPKWCPKRKEK